MNKKIEEIEFVIFDTETTGLDHCGGDRVVEIAGIRFKGMDRLGSFHSLVNPGGRPISPQAFEVNRISQEMLKDAPGMAEVIPGFLDFVKGSCLCSYNLPFDLGFLNNELRIAGYPKISGLALVDILGMSRKLLPGLEKYALWFVARSLGIEGKQEHRAFADVEMAWEVFRHLTSLVRIKGTDEFNGFNELFGYGGN